MANIWLAHDGPHPTRSEDPFKQLTLTECIAQLSLRSQHFLCGLHMTPRFNEQHSASIVGGPQHVVVEIDAEEANRHGWQSGFYIAPLSVAEAMKAI